METLADVKRQIQDRARHYVIEHGDEFDPRTLERHLADEFSLNREEAHLLFHDLWHNEPKIPRARVRS